MSGFFPYPVARNSLTNLASHPLSFRLVNFPSLPNRKKKQMNSAASDSDFDIMRIADPDLYRWPVNVTSKLKRSVNRGYAAFWRKRGQPEPAEPFQPSKFSKGGGE